MTSSNETCNERRPDAVKQCKTDFSIEHILTRAGNSVSNFSAFGNKRSERCMSFSWLQCTRYCPPKLPRSQKKDGPQRRQLGRHPRIPFSSQQLAVLEEKYKDTPYLSSAEVTQLSRTLHLAAIRVKIWFQNRRARERRERNEREIQQLQSYKHEIKQNTQVEETPVVVNLPATLNPLFVEPLSQQNEDQERKINSQTSKLDFKSITCLLKP